MSLQQIEVTTQAELDTLNAELSECSPQEIIRWAIDRFGEGLILACSFGGVSGMALLDMAVTIKPDIDVFYLDTDFLFPQTLKTRDAAIAKYGIQPVAFRSRLTPEQQSREYGDELWRRDPDKCCSLRKVEPNARALEGRTAWITGLRRDQASTRRNVQPVSWDHKFNLYKLNPLAYWTEQDVWERIHERDLPYHALHDSGYESIGCAPCTLRGEGRAGRWAGTAKTECGLHV